MNKLSRYKMSGFLVSEYMAAILTVIVLAGIGFGLYVSSERNGMVESAEESLVSVKKLIAAAEVATGKLVCDASLVSADVLTNPFVSFAIKPTPIDEKNLAKGYGAGVFIKSIQEKDGNDVFVTTERLYDAIKEKNGESLRLTVKEDEEIEFYVLLSETANCLNT